MLEQKEVKAKKGRPSAPMSKKDIVAEIEKKVTALIKKLVKKESLR